MTPRRHSLKPNLHFFQHAVAVSRDLSILSSPSSPSGSSSPSSLSASLISLVHSFQSSSFSSPVTVCSAEWLLRLRLSAAGVDEAAGSSPMGLLLLSAVPIASAMLQESVPRHLGLWKPLTLDGGNEQSVQVMRLQPSMLAAGTSLFPCRLNGRLCFPSLLTKLLASFLAILRLWAVSAPQAHTCAVTQPNPTL
eukprot:5210627-Pyramimonas_sp.AAC.1